MGVFGHKTFWTQSWWHFRDGGPKTITKKIHHDRLSFYTNHGLQHSEISRSETDYLFTNKTSYAMEPTLQWPNTDDYMDDWRMETHTEIRYSDSKMLAFFQPEYKHETSWDIGVLREENMLLFGYWDISELYVKEEYDDRFDEGKAYGFVWQTYHHW